MLCWLNGIELLFESLNLLNVTDILQQNMLKFYYKYTNGKLAHYLANILFLTQANTYMNTIKPQHEYAIYCII